jgi:hypothetical protein
MYDKRSMFFTDYNWNEYSETDPHVSGELDDTSFDRTEGYEILYLVNNLMEEWGLDEKNAGQKIERMIRYHLPQAIATQIEIKVWLKQNWKFY